MDDPQDLSQLENFCILPWVQAHLNQSGAVAPCCKVVNDFAYGNLKESDLQAALNSPGAVEMRRELLAGKSPAVCRECKALDRAGTPSLRTDSLKYHPVAVVQVLAERSEVVSVKDLTSLDIRFSNLCNFKCRSCGPEYSSSWEASGTGSRHVQLSKVDHFWPLMDSLIPQLQHLYIAGGEPSLDSDHFEFLKRLIAKGRKDIHVAYNSNLSKLSLRNHSWLEDLRQLPSVRLGISVDGAGPQAEVLRKGTVWTEIVDNIRTLKTEAPHVQLILNPTVSAMNIFHLPDAIRNWIATGLLTCDMDLQFNILFKPAYLSLNILNPKERELVNQRFASLRLWLQAEVSSDLAHKLLPQIDFLLQSFTEELHSDLRKQFRYVTFALDRKREESFVKHFPEHFEMLYVEPLNE